MRLTQRNVRIIKKVLAPALNQPKDITVSADFAVVLFDIVCEWEELRLRGSLGLPFKESKHE